MSETMKNWMSYYRSPAGYTAAIAARETCSVLYQFNRGQLTTTNEV
jgi:hypothetical protein